MKKQVLYWSILILPFLGMIMINELVRLNIKEEGYTKQVKWGLPIQGITAINSIKLMPDKCTWICHDKTDYCRENHVKLAKPYLEKTDLIYSGIIKFLKSTGNYAFANIIILVIILPLIMYILLVKSISLEFKIRKLKKG
ncbi:hypothetical protein N8383_01805 [Flavobacteriaceae bacterium]|nr:hypothetical protein [Flavobacteriaceae bacterium]